MEARTPESRAGDRGRGDWLLVAVMLLAAALRLHHLTTSDVWVDEANSILTAKQPLSVLLDMLGRDSSPPLYYLLLRGWMGIAGDGPAALRLPSVLFSLLLVAAVYAVGAREHSRRAGLWAAFLVALAPTQVYYSQQVRMYTLLPLLALAAWWLLVRYLRDGRARDFWLSMLATAAALYTHNFALYIPLVHAVLVVVSGQLFRRFRTWVVGAGFLVLVYAPWIPTLLAQIANPDHYAWYQERWEEVGILGAVVDTAKSWAPASSMIKNARVGPIDWHGVPAIVASGFALWGALSLVRRRGEVGRVGALWLPAACVVPVAASLAVSSFLTPHYVPGRVDQMMFPCFALLAGMGITALRPEVLQRAMVPVVLAVALVARGAFYTDYREHGLGGAEAELAAAVLRELRPGDVILCTSLTRAPLEYYLQRAGAEVPIVSYPRATARHLGSQNHRKLLADPASLREEARIVIDRARALSGPGGRLFLLRTNHPVNAPLGRASLERRFGIRQEARLGRFKLSGTKEVVWLTVDRLADADAAIPAPTPGVTASGAAAGPSRTARSGR